MSFVTRHLLWSLALGAMMPSASPQAPPAQQAPARQATPVIESSTQEVVLDMVFRDKKGRVLKDVRPEEVEVLEDGVPQKLRGFRLIQGKDGEPSPSDAQSAEKAKQLDPLREIRLVTLVFENLDVEGKRFFRQATTDLLAMAPEPNLYFSVFAIDQKLHCLQPFTSDHNAIKKEVERSQTWSFVQYSSQSAAIKQALEDVVKNTQTTASAQGQTAGAVAAGSAVAAALAQLQLNTLEFADSLDREIGARASLYALLSLVREQAQLPGRKIVIYFNPWFNVPDHFTDLFRTVISTANRSNVSFYTVDAKGLVTYSQGGSGRDQLASAARSSMDQSTAAARGGNQAVRPDQVKVFDKVQSSLRANSSMQLMDLAQSTGGFFIGDTNDWKAPLRKALDEVKTYYEAAYTPQVGTYDGKFRTISVRVNRPDIVVHARNGYFALPPNKGRPQMLAYEMPLLNALNQTTMPRDVSFRSGVYRFDRRGPKLEYMLTMEVPLKNIEFQVDPEKKLAKAHASVLAVFKDEKGEVVKDFSRDFPLQVPAEKLDGYKASNLIQTYRVELPPGRYTLSTAVMDENANKIGAKKLAVIAPPPTTQLAMSNVAFIRHVDAQTKEMEADPEKNPLHFEGGRVTPTLSDSMPGGPGKQLAFYFTVYPDAAKTEQPELTMQFFKDGQPLGKANAPLPKPDKNGVIPYISYVPADNFTAGQYELRTIVKQGSETAQETVFFTIE
jgi:VWFA-related protein